jgi:hypothetical protein
MADTRTDKDRNQQHGEKENGVRATRADQRKKIYELMLEKRWTVTFILP